MFQFLKNKKTKENKQMQSVKSDTISELALYYFPSCPYCRMVLKQINRQALDIELRNIHQEKQHKKQLIAGGGKKTVPCLKIHKADGSSYWMYESMDIIEFLQQTYS